MKLVWTTLWMGILVSAMSCSSVWAQAIAQISGAVQDSSGADFNFTGVAQTPKFSDRTLSILATGWRLSGLYRASSFGTIVAASQSQGSRTVTIGAASGSKSSGAASGDICLCDISNQRPNLLLPNALYLDTSGRPFTGHKEEIAGLRL